MRRHILNIYIDSYAYANLFLAKQTLVKVKDRVFWLNQRITSSRFIG